MTTPNGKRTASVVSSVLRDLFISPNLFVSDIAKKHGRFSAVCMRMSRQTYSESNFLDHRTVSVDHRAIDLPIELLAEAYRAALPASRPLVFIEHTAFCGSTLLSRCLDIPGVCLPYREPFLLHRLADLRRHGLWGEMERQSGLGDLLVLDLALALLARTYGETEKAAVKLTDSCISLCPDLLAHNEGSKILLLYNDLERFLVAMLKDDARRKYARAMLTRSRADLASAGKDISLSDEDLSDARCAAYAWVGLMYPYLTLLAKYPYRVRSLDAQEFFNHPRDVLCSLGRFFDLEITEDTVEKQLSQGILQKDSKRPSRSFESARYESDFEETKRSLQAEIDDAMEWISTVTSDDTIPEKLPSPLVTVS